jgi:RNA polymerase sigma factor (sigma-70 family)
VPVEHVGERADNFTDPLDSNLLESELRAALRVAFAELSQRCRRVLRLLTCDPPLTYAEIAEILDVTHGYVGPTRGRCLEELRSRPVMAPFLQRASS